MATFDLEQILSQGGASRAPAKAKLPQFLVPDPVTGEPGVYTPETEAEAKAVAKQLAPDGRALQNAPATGQIASPEQLGGHLADTPMKRAGQQQLEDMSFRDVFNLDREKVKQLIMAQEQGTADQQQTLQNLKESPLGINLRAFGSFLATMNPELKGAMAALPGGETPEERAAKVAEIQKLIESGQNSTTNNALELLKANVTKRQGELAGRQARFEDSQITKMEQELQKDLEKNIFEPMSRYSENVGTMEELIGQGTMQSVQQALSTFARAVTSEKGVLTDQDVNRIYPASLEMALTRAGAWLSSNPNAKLPPEVIQGLQNAIALSKANSQSVFNERVGTRDTLYRGRRSMQRIMGTGQFGPTALGEARRRVGEFGTVPKASGGKTAPAGGLPTQDALAAEIERRKAQKQ